MNFVSKLSSGLLLEAMNCKALLALALFAPAAVAIVNGELIDESTRAAANHVVGLRIHYPPAVREICTGTLIARNVILTAAHCVAGDYSAAEAIFADQIDGSNSRPVIAKTIHPRWNPAADIDSADLALVRIAGEAPAPYSPAQLLRSHLTLNFMTPTRQFGFGVFSPTAKDPGVGILRQAQVALVDMPFAKTEVLTDESHGQGICQGDSGGPSFMIEDGELRQWGVASRTIDTATTDADSSAISSCNGDAVITNLLPYKSWIKSESKKLQLKRF